jgi:hypothetical protein
MDVAVYAAYARSLKTATPKGSVATRVHRIVRANTAVPTVVAVNVEPVTLDTSVHRRVNALIRQPAPPIASARNAVRMAAVVAAEPAPQASIVMWDNASMAHRVAPQIVLERRAETMGVVDPAGRALPASNVMWKDIA